MPYPNTPDTAMEFQPPTADILSVTSLNRLARSLLETQFPAVLVEGEISNLSVPSSGHWYLSLKDQSSQIRCAMFRNRNMHLRFQPKNGMQVIVKGRLSIYEGRGDYQLIADDMEEAGAGLLRKAFEALKAKLAAEGLFDFRHKKALTGHYRHIGVITSATGAAIHDVLSVFARRFPALQITLFPVAVQGNEAKHEIVRALNLANKLASKLGIEALIVGRGGGSLEDLQAFNEEDVARAIFTSVLPVVSAVGHEIDFTIADFVADLRAPTPSAAAELLSPDQQEYSQLLASFKLQISNLITQKLRQSAQNLSWLRTRLKHPGRRLQEHAQTMDILEQRMTRAVSSGLKERRNRLRELARALHTSSPERLINNNLQQVQTIQRRLLQSIKQSFSAKHTVVTQLARSLNAISPLATLGRGFSITYDENHEVLRDSGDVKIGSQVMSRLKHGYITATVSAISAEQEVKWP